MSLIPGTADYSSMSASQILEQKRKIAEETKKLDEVLKAKMEEQRAGFVQNVAEQVQALEIQPHEFIESFKAVMKLGEGAAFTAEEVFKTIPDSKLEDWFSDFNKLKNQKLISGKTAFFKLSKMTRAGLSDTKFSTIYFEDIKGGEKGLQAIAKKIGKTREEAKTKLFDSVKPDDARIETVLDMLYPAPATAPAEATKPAKKTGKP